jgi:hypothetical protein
MSPTTVDDGLIAELDAAILRNQEQIEKLEATVAKVEADVADYERLSKRIRADERQRIAAKLREEARILEAQLSTHSSADPELKHMRRIADRLLDGTV